MTDQHEPALKVGDKVMILEDWHMFARVYEGDILTVLTVDDSGFETDAPRLDYPGMYWSFVFKGEGIGWEKYEEEK